MLGKTPNLMNFTNETNKNVVMVSYLIENKLYKNSELNNNNTIWRATHIPRQIKLKIFKVIA